MTDLVCSAILAVWVLAVPITTLGSRPGADSGLDNDDRLRRVLTDPAGGVVVLATVTSRVVENKGTRSETTVYTVKVSHVIDGSLITESLPTVMPFAHYGRPLLVSGRRYTIGTIGTRRFSAGWQIVFASDVNDLPVEKAVELVKQRIERVKK